MIKVYALLPRRADLTAEQFREHWSTVHREHALKIERLRRYVQSHRAEPDLDGLPAAPYQGLPEVWYDSLESAVGQDDDPAYLEGAKRDEPNFVDMDGIAWVMTADRLLRADDGTPAADAPLAKVLVLAKRPSGADRAAFAADWEALAERAADTEGVVRAAVATALPETYGESEPVYDGVLELWWPDEAALAAGWAAHGPQLVDAVRALADPQATHLFHSAELRVIWPGPAFADPRTRRTSP